MPGSNPASVAALFEQSDWVLRLARKLISDPAAAEDIAQQTMAAALRSGPDSDRPLRPWLASVAGNFARRWQRGESRRAIREHGAARRENSVPSAGELAEARDTLAVLVDELQELDAPLRDVVTLRYLRDLDSRQIGERLGVPSGTVRWRLREGLAQLRERLDRRFGSRSGWAGCLVSVLGTERAATVVGAGAGMLLAVATLTAGTLWWTLAPTRPADAVPIDPGLATTVPGRTTEVTETAAAGRVAIAPTGPSTTTTTGARPANEPRQRNLGPLERGEAGLATRILDDEGRPLPGAELSWPGALDLFRHADEAGEVSARLRPPSDGGQIRVRVSVPGYATAVVTPRVATGHWTELDPVTLVRSARIEGRVLDERGQPLSGGHVLVTPASPDERPEGFRERGPDPWRTIEIPPARTGPDGRFTVTSVPATRVRVWAGHPGRSFAFSDELSPTPDATPDPITLRCWPLPGSSAIDGVVVDSRGTPIAGSRVRFTPRLGDPAWPAGHAWRRRPVWVDTDDHGRFRFRARLGILYDLIAEDEHESLRPDVRTSVPPGSKDLQLMLMSR